ncbi:hypothetical protein NSA56_18300 [Oceanobacillus caeni]|uniref:hypothetical protein n=1 Tax=Oceanobacillus TaxID=182709 RepID=UPI0006225BA9|nr:hypothetical protein WH51_04225 [Bacilli bacterium VT-13-104]MBU8790530.1 hypothetical protein [Oceanobacillus caeni]PZD85982.1 hypothetical protein DEJ64_08900 [Bacilli bacterium]MCR1836266.1 hypothetical protein [Oceanobacillus caeni]PZD87370.1 hypothetical protein DEJ60_08715 [Bacilli bacterium]
MKKYIIFVVSFLLVFSLIQVLSGILLTYTYTPDMMEAWNLSPNLTQEVVIKGSHPSLLLTLLIGLISVTIAYFISKKYINKH